MKALIWHDEQLGAKFDEVEIPEEYKAKAKELHTQLVEMAVEEDEKLLEAYLEGTDADRRADSRPASARARRVPLRAGDVRLGLQEQGRAAAARCRCRLSAVAARHSAGRRHRSRQGRRSRRVPPTTRRRSPVSRSRSWTIPFVGSHHLRARLFRHGVLGHGRAQFRQGQERARRPHAADACEQPRRHEGSLRRRHRRVRGPEIHDDRRDALRSEQSGHPGDAWNSPIPSSKSRSSRRPKPIRKRWAWRSRVWPRKIRRSASRPIRNPARPSSRAWASSTSKSKSTSCSAHLQGRCQCRRAAGGLSRDAVEARHHPVHAQEADRRFGPVRRSEDRVRAACRRARVLSSRTTSSAARFRRNSFPSVEKGLKAQKESGLLAGFPVIDFKATLVDGKYHEVDSNALTFDIAARAAFRELASQRRRSSCSSRS